MTKNTSKKISNLPEKVILKIKVLFNSTRIDVTNSNGDVFIWKTSKSVGFKHSKKSTPLASATVVKNACEEAYKRGAKEAIVEIIGIGVGRSAALKKALESNLKISEMKHIIKLAHNGVRPKKARRV